MRYPNLFMFAVLSAIVPVAVAQPVSPPVRPYAPVAISLPAASTDADFIAFRNELAAVAKSRIYAALEPLVQLQGFFWERDFKRMFDPRRAAVDNLAAALQLERHDGSGWGLLAALATEGAIEPMASWPGVVCAPAPPKYDGVAFARLLNATHTKVANWFYPRLAEPELRLAPQPEAEVLDRLRLQFVRLLGFDGANGVEPAPERRLWARVATSDGKPGFVAPGNLTSLTAARLCYVRDLIGGWRIAGFIAAGE